MSKNQIMTVSETPEASKLKWIRVDDVSKEAGMFWLSIQFNDCFSAGCAIGYGATRNDVVNKLRELADILEKKSVIT